MDALRLSWRAATDDAPVSTDADLVSANRFYSRGLVDVERQPISSEADNPMPGQGRVTPVTGVCQGAILLAHSLVGLNRVPREVGK